MYDATVNKGRTVSFIAESAIQVQIQDEVVSLHANTLEKGMNLSFPPPAPRSNG